MARKRFAALLTAAALCFTSLPAIPIPAAPAAAEDMIDESYIEDVLYNYEQYIKITTPRDGDTPWLLKDDGYAYMLLAQRMKDTTKGQRRDMRWAYSEMGETLTVDDCIHYLLVAMQIIDSGMDSNLEAQAKYDSGKHLEDYMIDTLLLAGDAFGLAETTGDLKVIQQAAGISDTAVQLTVNAKERIESYVVFLKKYEQHKVFLETVHTYAKEPKLQKASEYLLVTIKTMFAYELYQAGQIVKDDTLPIMDLGLSVFDEEFEHWAETKFLPKLGIQDTATAMAALKKTANLAGSFKLGADLGTLIGDIFIGNEFRYLKEVMMLDDITFVLQKGLKEYDPANQLSPDSRYQTLKVRVPLLTSLCAVRTRGEYCANMIAQAHDTLFGVFIKDNHEKTAHYDTALSLQQREYQLISEIFIVDDFPVSLLWYRPTQTIDRTNGELLTRIDLLYPEIGYKGDREAQKKIENRIREDAMTVRDYYLKEDSWTNPNTDIYYSGGGNNSYEMCLVPNTRMDRHVISIVFRQVEYWHGAIHPYSWYRSYNFDPETGDLLTMSDILADGSAYKKLGNLLLSLKPVDYYERPSGEKENFASNASNSWNNSTAEDNSVSWYFNHNGLCLTYSPYEIASYASGFITWEIPYEELQGILKDQYLSVKARSQKGREIEAEVKKSVDVTKAHNIIMCDGPGDGKYNLVFKSPEIVYDVCLYSIGDPLALGYGYDNRPLVTLSSLSPATALLVSCGQSSREAPNILARWTDGYGNQREAFFWVDESGEALSNITQ